MEHHQDSDHSSPRKPLSTFFRKYLKRVGDLKPSRSNSKVPPPNNLKESSLPRPRRPSQTSTTHHELCSDLLQISNTQLQSSFCSRLPREIRLEIFRYVLGGRDFHLRYGDGKMRPYICRYPCVLGSEAGTGHARCWDQHFPHWRKHHISSSLGNLLPLLKTCNHIYSEALSALYANNTFSFRGVESLKSFSALVPRQAFDAIQSLTLYVYLPSDSFGAQKDYDVLWPLLASMAGLRDLRIQLAMHWGASTWKANEEIWVTPVDDFRALKTFVLWKNVLIDACQANQLDFSRSWSRKQGWSTNELKGTFAD